MVNNAMRLLMECQKLASKMFSRVKLALGCAVYDEFVLYREAEERSKRRCGLL